LLLLLEADPHAETVPHPHLPQPVSALLATNNHNIIVKAPNNPAAALKGAPSPTYFGPFFAFGILLGVAYPQQRGIGWLKERDLSDREVIEIMTGNGQNPPNAAHHEALAEFLCRVQAEIADEAKRGF
jgi:hypothetical protein